MNYGKLTDVFALVDTQKYIEEKRGEWGGV